MKINILIVVLEMLGNFSRKINDSLRFLRKIGFFPLKSEKYIEDIVFPDIYLKLFAKQKVFFVSWNIKIMIFLE